MDGVEMAVEVLDEGIIKVPNPTGDVYILAVTARGCAFGEDMTARWREVEVCQRRDAVQGYMNTYAQLKPEPKNKFDPQAIEVLARGEFFGHMGYIAKEQTDAVRALARYAGCDLKDIAVQIVCTGDVGFKSVRLALIAAT